MCSISRATVLCCAALTGCFQLTFSEWTAPDTASAGEAEGDAGADRTTGPTDSAGEDPCHGVRCTTPPDDARSCDIGATDAVVRQSRNGYCAAGPDGEAECRYAEYVAPCILGACVDGTCPGAPGQATYCLSPPPPRCDGDTLITHYHQGVVTDTGGCAYDTMPVACENGCVDNACVDDPCAGVTCNDPPARHCAGDTLLTYEPLGVCDDKGGCVYPVTITPCEQGCAEGRCLGESPCRYTDCITPPASFCLDENTLYAYSGVGLCDEGACVYRGEKIACRCADGRCQADRCLGVSCLYPPPARCTRDGLIRFWDGNAADPARGIPGPCDDGVCRFELREALPCDPGRDAPRCRDGQCTNGACVGLSLCIQRPTPLPYCVDRDRFFVQGDGACQGDNGRCAWPWERERCPNDCEEGVCSE